MTIPTTRRERYTAEEYAAAKSVDLAAFLMANGYELTRHSGCYKGKLHDSLVIRDDGRWYWNSRDLHGYSPVELYKHILLNDYGYTDEVTAALAAVKQLAGSRGAYTFPERKPKPTPTRAPDTPLRLPPPNINNNHVMAYLCRTRGLDPEITRRLIGERKIYEDIPYHNAVFVAYDSRDRPQNAFMRGTISMAEKTFKRDVDFSDKSYPFTVSGHKNSDAVYCFESVIDAISHASLYKLTGQEWNSGHRISLGGTSFLGLDRFLSDNPRVARIVSCLDNDETGNRRSARLADEYAAMGYTVEREAPLLKDFNEDLLDYLQQESEEDLEL
ncbi:MAG: DUF3991 and toprim domain-containing protein [Oscillospiraceae bacterium]|nr:DUF3991 and toprim domain-containing protein [Oscillospiraceae bacterium]